ncbi:ABC transporter substrate-binding protein [Subtercola boreus]|uniref:Nitrate ABC transporter substrate-binding protein n=1 Tax=Subtercola boreus TaxID=120213 RepID=A0A3E0WEJ6_9MICO|nr:ABC transporter substrate-binding protein [Subtercola boreus]RFA21993.1 nitrate ABC transporter substrate-binding protein [Subtercola boreus]RFA22173.1 nitrate ABC transporter substrate-binding protein [Subtercola boreus]RFA28035.1 nitrate ABC transporter substrate-binding protein [Subtercola boreus]
MRKQSKRVVLASGLAILSMAALAACSSGGATTTPAASAAAGGVDLAAAGCPATVVIQTDWNPEAEHGHLYELLGPNPVVDANQKSVSGPLYSNGAATGVNVEIRSGGPAIGFQTVTSQMYADPDITLGYVTTDEAVQLSADQPTTAVFAPLDKTPLMIMWDPATYPNVKTIADLGKTDAVVRYFGGSAYMEYLISAGLLSKDKTDGSYDGTPASFVADQGKAGQQGFASAEPYQYQYEVPAWGKAVNYQTIGDAGYPVYASAVSIKTGDKEKLSGCLKALVPVLQQAEVDYFDSPDAVNTMILDLVTQFNTGWVYSQGMADYSVKTQKDLGLVGNGDNSTIGDMDEINVQKIIDVDTPIYAAGGKAVKSGLTPADIFTNEFIDTSIGLK